MSIQTITSSNSMLDWPQSTRRVQSKAGLNIPKEKNTLAFVSDSVSTKDEITKSNSLKTESTKAVRPFSHTSENWIG